MKNKPVSFSNEVVHTFFDGNCGTWHRGTSRISSGLSLAADRAVQTNSCVTSETNGNCSWILRLDCWQVWPCRAIWNCMSSIFVWFKTFKRNFGNFKTTCFNAFMWRFERNFANFKEAHTAWYLRKKNPGPCRSFWLHTASSMKVVASVLMCSTMRKPRYHGKVEKWKNWKRPQVPTKARANDRPPFSELASHKTTCCSVAEDCSCICRGCCKTKFNNMFNNFAHLKK